jgi:hypothetical protein
MVDDGACGLGCIFMGFLGVLKACNAVLEVFVYK